MRQKPDRRELTAEILRSLLRYDPDTGLVERIRSNPNAGNGCPDARGYVRLLILGKLLKVHRLACLYMTGAWPSGEVDHINGDKSDNRWANLRVTDRATNAENQRAPRADNTTGFLGVSRHDLKRKPPVFTAQINVRGRVTYLGRFATPEQAHAVYLEAKRRLHAGCTI